MSLVELPSRDHKIIAVNPHHVSAVQAYTGYVTGEADSREMSAVWVNGHNVYVCIWDVATTVDALNQGRHRDADAFQAGFRAGAAAEWATDGDPDVSTHVETAFRAWIGEGLPE